MNEIPEPIEMDPDKKEIDDLLYGRPLRGSLLDLFESKTISYPYENKRVVHEKDGIEYDLDSLGLRNPHLASHKQVDTIFLGCSHTWGYGLPSDFIWTKLLSDFEDTKSYVNLAYPGASIYSQMQSLFGYIQEHGEPKKIIAHFPELTRMRIPTVRSKFDITSDSSMPVGLQDFIWVGDKDLVKYSKRPHMIQEVVPPEVFYYISIQSIITIQNYATSRGITFLWDTWHPNSRHFFDSVKKVVPSLEEFFMNYVQKRPEDEKPSMHGDIDCSNGAHYAYKDDNPEIFDFATDNLHAGIHLNLHVAENFYEQLLKKVN